MMKRAPGSAMSPSASSTMGLQAEWMSSTGDILQPPAVQLPSRRLKSGLEEYQKKLLDEILSSASPLSSWKTSSSIAAVSAATGPRVSDYGDLFGSLEHSKLTQLQAKQFTGTNSARLQTNQSLDHQLLSGYGSNLPSSPNVMSSSSFDLEHSMTKAILNSRQAAFAKRSQSFTDRGASPRPPPGISPTPTSSPPSAALGVSNWGSPDGKLDWVIQGDELNKLKRSATFSFRSTGISNFEGFAPIAASKTPALEEPDFSWVQHLVKDGPPAINRLGMDMNGQHVLDLTWDQLYAEQDQVQTVP
ncbi:hypothetical protein HPP92_006498 [Vanilla planifolia]|uniref:Uncharacterized protein n=1 Tax=Vanilla planifolia TaxID=51239 RepID=A0A835RCA0_VANPL|nr:hypothetical protein HPP92_006498 [Vanilla planifolia]